MTISDNRRSLRDRIASQMKVIRSMEVDGRRAFTNEQVRDLAARFCGVRYPNVPPRPTAAGLIQEALAILPRGKFTPENPYSNEYYTACGYDDYLSELKDARKREAAGLYAEALRLGHPPVAELLQQLDYCAT